MSNKNTTGGGISFLALLGLTFIILKLCKVIDWSWWYVTLPLWAGVATALLVLLIGVIISILLGQKSEPKTTMSTKTSNFQKRLELMAKERAKKNGTSE